MIYLFRNSEPLNKRIMHQQLDIVDVHLSSQKNSVDALFIEPLLDNEKKYTVEVTEFQCSLNGESALPPVSFFRNEGGGTGGTHNNAGEEATRRGRARG